MGGDTKSLHQPTQEVLEPDLLPGCVSEARPWLPPACRDIMLVVAG